MKLLAVIAANTGCAQQHSPYCGEGAALETQAVPMAYDCLKVNETLAVQLSQRYSLGADMGLAGHAPDIWDVDTAPSKCMRCTNTSHLP